MLDFEPPDPITDDQISGEEKLYRVTRLIKELRDDFEQVNLLPFERNAHMEQLKVFGRNPKNAEPIFTPSGIEIITHHSFHATSPTTSRAALQCLANALLAEPVTRQYFVDLGYSERAVRRLKKPQKDDEFLMSRILFLTSYGTTQRFDVLIDKFHLAEYMSENLERHAKSKSRTQHDDEALNETLKLVFNIAHFCPSHASSFSAATPSIMKILARRPIQTPPLIAPTNLLITSLLTIPLPKKPISTSTLTPCIKQLLAILDATLAISPDHDLDATVTPLITLLQRFATHAPPAAAALRSTVLPENSKAASGDLHVRLTSHLEQTRSRALSDAIATLFQTLAGSDRPRLRPRRSSGASASTISTNGSHSRPTAERRGTSYQKDHADSQRLSTQSDESAREDLRRTSSTSTANRTHGSNSSAGSADAILRGGDGKRKSKNRVDAAKVMVLFDRLRITHISDTSDPRMREMVVELDGKR